MPNYQTHDSIGMTVAVASTIIPYATQTLSAEHSILLGISIFIGTYLLSPDLDTDSMIYSRWGIFKWYWYPYKQLIKHRSIWSHSGPLSATLRLLYLLWIPTMYLSITQFEIMRDFIEEFYPALLLIWAGIIISDIIHVICDITVTGIKRLI